MCVIVELPKHIALSRKILKNCYEHNPDGFGIMAHVDGKIVVEKSMGDFRKFLEIWKNFPQNSHRAIHFRWATHGDVAEKNCHPFDVTPDLYLMHNGVITTVEVDKTFSDSWNFAKHDLGREEIIQSWGERPLRDSPDQFRAMLERCSGGSKLFLMDSDGAILRTFEAGWHKANGCMFSNEKSTKPRVVYTSPYSGSYDWRKPKAESKSVMDKAWDEEGYYDDVYGPSLYSNGRNVKDTGKDFISAGSDLLPYGRVVEDDDSQDWAGNQADLEAETEITITDLYNMSEEDIADFVQDDPWAATDLFLLLLGRDTTSAPLFDKTGNA